MNFSNKFKIFWWICVLIILSLIGFYRIYIAEFNNFDVVLVILWFSLVLFPIISEVSFFGFNVKKDIENATKEIKSSIMEIKNNFQPTININNLDRTDPSESELKAKAEKEIKEEDELESFNCEKSIFSLEENNEPKQAAKNEKIKERTDKLLKIEKLVNERLYSKYENRYKPNTKLKNESLGKSIIVDGLIFEDVDTYKIDEIVEIKYITQKSFIAFYYIAFKFIQKLYKFGLRIPVHFIIIADSIDEFSASFLNKQILKVNSNKDIIPSWPISKISCYKIVEDNLTEIIIKK